MLQWIEALEGKGTFSPTGRAYEHAHTFAAEPAVAKEGIFWFRRRIGVVEEDGSLWKFAITTWMRTAFGFIFGVFDVDGWVE